MSAASGQTRTQAPQQPITLFDHFVGGSKQFIWNGNAERLGGLEIDQKLKRRRLLDRQVPDVCAREDPVHK